jgi:integrase/recombinase XerD
MTAGDALVPIDNDAASPALPALTAGAGDRAAVSFLEFFTVNIRNRNTRAAYARAARREGHWIGELGRVQPMHVAVYSRPSERSELRARTESSAARDRSRSPGAA